VPDFDHLPTPAQHCVIRTTLKRGRSRAPLSSAQDDSRAAQCAHSKTHVVPRETLSTHFDTRCAVGVARCVVARARVSHRRSRSSLGRARTIWRPARSIVGRARSATC